MLNRLYRTDMERLVMSYEIIRNALQREIDRRTVVAIEPSNQRQQHQASQQVTFQLKLSNSNCLDVNKLGECVKSGVQHHLGSLCLDSAEDTPTTSQPEVTPSAALLTPSVIGTTDALSYSSTTRPSPHSTPAVTSPLLSAAIPSFSSISHLFSPEEETKV